MNLSKQGSSLLLAIYRELPLGGTVSSVLDGPPIGRHEVASSFVILAFVTSGICLLMTAVQPLLLSWFLLPVAACGLIVGTDAVEWFRGRLDMFDIRGLMSVLGYHFFFVAPLCMVAMDWRMQYLPDQPSDYRDWIGGMALLNMVGLLFFRTAERKAARSGQDVRSGRSGSNLWTIDESRFWIFVTVLLLASASAEAYILYSFGGLRGYVGSYTSALAGDDQFQGLSLLFGLAESLPILGTISLAVWSRSRPLNPALLGTFVLLLASADFLISGLRGSRSNVIWSLFWMFAIVHGSIRRIPRVAAFAGIAGLLVFVSLYASYKQRGDKLFEAVSSSGDYSSISQGAEGPATVLVGDFSRADVQAYLLYKRFFEDPPELAWGRTYIGTFSLLVPRVLLPDRPTTVTKWTTEAEYGNGAYGAGGIVSSRVYGIAGEAMLNFGIVAVPFSYAFLGLLVGLIERHASVWGATDCRRLILPFVVVGFFVILLDDSDNVMFYLIKYGLVPIALVLASASRREARSFA